MTLAIPGLMLGLILLLPSLVVAASFGAFNEDIITEIMEFGGIIEEARLSNVNKLSRRVSQVYRPSMHRLADNLGIPEMASLSLHQDLLLFEGVKFEDKKEALEHLFPVKEEILKESEVEEALNSCFLNAFLSTESANESARAFILVQAAKRPEYWPKLLEFNKKHPEYFKSLFASYKNGPKIEEYPYLSPLFNSHPEFLIHVTKLGRVPTNSDEIVITNEAMISKLLFHCDLNEDAMRALFEELFHHDARLDSFLVRVMQHVRETKDVSMSLYHRIMLVADNVLIFNAGALQTNLLRIRFDPEYLETSDWSTDAFEVALHAGKYSIAAQFLEKTNFFEYAANLSKITDGFCRYLIAESPDLMEKLKNDTLCTLEKLALRPFRPQICPELLEKIFFSLPSALRTAYFGQLFRSNCKNTALMLKAFESLEAESSESHITIDLQDLLQVSPEVFNLMKPNGRFKFKYEIEQKSLVKFLDQFDIKIPSHIQLDASLLPPLERIFMLESMNYSRMKRFMQLFGDEIGFKKLLPEVFQFARLSAAQEIGQFWRLKTFLQVWLGTDYAGCLHYFGLDPSINSSAISSLLDEYLDGKRTPVIQLNLPQIMYFSPRKPQNELQAENKAFQSHLLGQGQIIFLFKKMIE